MPCVYMLYENVGEPESPNCSDDEEEEEGNIEIRIAPQNENQGKWGAFSADNSIIIIHA